MKIFTRYIGLSLLVGLFFGADTMAQEADDWYQNHYAPLWKENSWDKIEEASLYYAETTYLHPPDGTITAVDSREWIARSIAGWKSDGWLGSVIAEYLSDQVNPSTVVFKVKWRDWYADGSEEFSCGWYLADLEREKWLFTQYAEIDCAEHDL